MYQCPYAPAGAVECERKQCEKCGWNPEVAAARLEAIIEKMTGEKRK
jgi:hypothetical protein